MQPSVDNLPGGVITNNVTPDRGGGGTAPCTLGGASQPELATDLRKVPQFPENAYCNLS